MQEKNYYEIFQINNSAESEAIHAAYKHISKEYQYSEFGLYYYILKMQELNKAYFTLVDEDNRTEYDEGLESESALELEREEANVEVPFEIDEESAKKNKVKVESCSFYLDGGGDIEAIGEIISTNDKDIEGFIEIHFNVYDSNNKLISATKTYGNRAGKRITFDMHLFIKSKSATPAKVKIYFS